MPGITRKGHLDIGSSNDCDSSGFQHPVDFIHFAVASATRITLSTVNSLAMIARQPSVPNLMGVILSFFCAAKIKVMALRVPIIH